MAVIRIKLVFLDDKIFTTTVKNLVYDPVKGKDIKISINSTTYSV